jgi:hypothetical protein
MIFSRTGGLVLALSTLLNSATAQPVVQIVGDLIELFPTARTNGCLECEPRPAASADGVKLPALFEHPASASTPARIQYELPLPALTPGEHLLFAFEVALSDGVQPGRGMDGVRFAVEADGERLFTREVRQTHWEPVVIDLTSHAPGPLQLTLVTEAIGNTAFDWALWGQPRVLRLPASTSGTNAIAGRYLVPVAVGVIAATLETNRGVKVHLRPDYGEALEFSVPQTTSSAPSAVWWLKEFGFPGARRVEVDWEPKNALTPSNVRIAAHEPRLKLTQFGTLRAINYAGQRLPLRAEVVNLGPGQLASRRAYLDLQFSEQIFPSKALPALAPGESFRTDWTADAAPRAGRFPATAQLRLDARIEQRTSEIELLTPRRLTRLIENERLALSLSHQSRGYAFAEVAAREGNAWKPVAVLTPLFAMTLDTRSGERDWNPLPRSLRRFTPADEPGSAELRGQARDPDGVLWQVLLRVTLETNAPAARLHYEWKAGRERRIRALWGPNLYVGDGTTGDAKTWALFPGLEFLYGPESSSNPRDFTAQLADRRTPQPSKTTAPLMAVTVGPDSRPAVDKPGRFFTPDSLKDRASVLPSAINHLPSAPTGASAPLTVALTWDPLQKWDGEHSFPSARFASPNFDTGMANHRLALFLPSTPDYVPENATQARKPYVLPEDKTLSLDVRLVVTPGPALVAMREWLESVGGLPEPNPWPRSFQSELDVCRAGFLETIWDAKSQGWRHCLDLPSGPAPGFAALLWLDSHVTESATSRQRSRERVELAATSMLRNGGPALFMSQAACHIMQWEFPFYYGYLPEAIESLDGQIHILIESQQPDGGWVFQPGSGPQGDLGEAGDSVLGTCAPRAMTLLRYARITGDTNALAAGEKALRFMETFRVPRGAQTWECPMYEPDILAAAYAVRAYHDAWRATGNARWLHDAVYWAETGLPFLYLWALPNKPMMLGATIPVFGSTSYAHSWLGVPVQWCGLVYAYHVWQLAQDLEREPLPRSDSPLPLALEFSAADWKRVVKLVTVSATYQQFAEGPKLGLYPDSISNFETRNPLFINPEDILVNVLAVNGVNADVKTARVRSGPTEVVISSGAAILNVTATPRSVEFDLTSFAGEPGHALVTGLKPTSVRVNGKPLTESSTPLRREPGWWWDSKRARLYLTVSQEGERPVNVAISR